MYRTQIPPATALKDQVLVSNGQQWGYQFDYQACRVKLYTVAEGEEYTDQTLGVDYRLEDIHVDAWSSISATRKPATKTFVMGIGDFRLRMLNHFKSWDLMELKMLVDGRSFCTEPTAAEHFSAKEVHNKYES